MLCAALAVAGYMAAVIQWSFDRGFLEYVNLEEQSEIKRLAQLLEAYYEKHQSWDTLVDRPLEILKIHALTMPEGRKRDRLLELAERGNLPDWILKPEGKEGKELRHPIQRTLVLDADKNILFGQKIGSKLPHLIPLHFKDNQIGSLGLYPPKKITETHHLLFVEKQKLVILMVGIASIFITIGISLPLSYHLTKPIRNLSQAARHLISGDYSTRVRADAADELGRLSRDFNTLAATLEENEIQRKLWVSDIAHELRTPLTTLQGEIEALQDGIREPGKRTYDNLHKGIMRLGRLVEDLYDLSRSDLATNSITPEHLDFNRLVENEITTFRHEADRAGLTLELNNPSSSTPIWGDEQRLQQLIGNLITNSIKYTQQGGLIKVALQKTDSSVQLDIQDTAPGVPDEALPKLFNRLYRVEKSRNRSLGGAGLGLAICLQIVKAHHGTINAKHSTSGGLWVQVSLPLAKEAS